MSPFEVVHGLTWLLVSGPDERRRTGRGNTALLVALGSAAVGTVAGALLLHAAAVPFGDFPGRESPGCTPALFGWERAAFFGGAVGGLRGAIVRFARARRVRVRVPG